MVRRRDTRRTRERLLEEGVAAFLEQGYHGTGIKDVLDRVSVPKGSFYNYFESKEAFGAAAIEHYSECLGRKMSDALQGASEPLAGLRSFFESLQREFEEADYVGGCLVANLGGELEGSDLCRNALRAAWRSWRDAVRDALIDAQERGTVRDDLDADELADLLVQAWEGAVIRMKIERSSEPLRQVLRRLLDDYFRPAAYTAAP